MCNTLIPANTQREQALTKLGISNGLTDLVVICWDVTSLDAIKSLVEGEYVDISDEWLGQHRQPELIQEQFKLKNTNQLSKNVASRVAMRDFIR